MSEIGYDKSKEVALKAARTAAAVLALSGLVAGEASAKADASHRGIRAAYLETDLTPRAYAPIDKLDPRKLNRLILAFDTPGHSGRIGKMELSSPITKTVGRMAAGSDLMLAIGGEGANKTGWAAALKNPKAFADSAKHTLAGLETQTGRRFDGIDIDFEFPAAGQGGRLVALVRQLRRSLPNDKISIAIPPTSYNREGFELSKLAPLVDNFDVMAYDFHGPWEHTAGDIASGRDVIQSIEQTTRQVSPSKVVVGFPGYGYIYNKAKRRHGKFNGAAAVNYNQLKTPVSDNARSLSSDTFVGGSWTSVQSPKMIRRTYLKLRQEHPGLAGAFYWQLPDLVESHLDAIK